MSTQVRLTRGQFNVAGKKALVVSMRHGYLWIGGDDGPCLLHVSGPKTLRKIARMISRYAR